MLFDLVVSNILRYLSVYYSTTMSDTHERILTTCDDGRVEELRSLLSDLDGDARQDPALFKKMLRRAAKSCQLSTLQYLISQNPSFTVDRDTGLAVAIGGSVEIYEALYTVDKNIINLHFGHTGDPVTVAVSTSNVPVLSFLLEKGANPNAGRHLSRWSPINLAARGSSPEIIPLLTKHGAQTSGSNALQNAVKTGRPDLVQALLKCGADVNDAPDYRHLPRLFDHLETPLHTAVRLGKRDMVEILLQHGANPKLSDSEGKTVEMRAQENGRADIIEALRNRRE